MPKKSPVDLRVSLEEDGGLAYFPGLAVPYELNSGGLHDPDANELGKLVDATLAVAGRRDVKMGKTRGADMKTYTLKIHEGETTRTLSYSESTLTTEARALVQFISNQRTAKSTARKSTK